VNSALPTTTGGARQKEAAMPYNTTDDLPESLRAHMPHHAQEIFRATFNNAWRRYRALSHAALEERAHRIAWGAVKRRYRKAGDAWVPRREPPG
jgi:cation transport regulator